MENTIQIKINLLEDLSEIGKYIKKGQIMEKINLSKIVRDLGCDRRTVKKYIENTERKERKQRTSVVEEHHAIIENIVDNNNYSYIQHIYNKLVRDNGAEYSLSTFKHYYYKHFNGKTGNRKVTARYETEPGFQAQIDYKENQVISV